MITKHGNISIIMSGLKGLKGLKGFIYYNGPRAGVYEYTFLYHL